MMAIDRHRDSRLTRRLYEASIVFAFATLIALFMLLAVGTRTRGGFACAARSIATASARCAGAADIGDRLPSRTVNVVFSADPGRGNAER
jgi:hypothetical protein